MKIVKIVFSPTGGTKKIIETVAQEYPEDAIQIDLTNPNLDFKEIIIDSNDLVLIGVPSYGGRVPETALKRLNQINGNEAKTILVVSYGNRDYDDTLIELYDRAVQNQFSPIAAITAVAQHSIIPQFASGRPDEKDLEELREFSNKIQNNSKDILRGIPGNRPYKESLGLSLVPKANVKCTQCRLCFDLCPVEAIDKYTLKADKTKCLSCMRCVKFCPKKARKVNKLLTTAAALMLKKSASGRKVNQLFIF